ncbi:hypothetical protein LV82_02574 [Albidovulum inexpectatum]|uniref:Uncharacterized protein n=1 Tax=Albidovulum inexpectatum TaxID=196587 RepID=A0A2S5JE95_9RHOB|nr:hypothetical protein [Albidovulum inexpectatum]PPB79783.1 hypothetical protein LV82_02574 [Albidovulum inexpectatum]
MTVIIGIDPGRNGGMARLYRGDCGMWRVDVIDLPQTPGDLEIALAQARPAAFAVVEKPFYPPHIGIRSIARIAEGYGALKAMLFAAGIPIREVAPREWKASLNVPADKAAARRRAEEFFPDDAHQWSRAKDDGRAEAALIAWYGRRWA